MRLKRFIKNAVTAIFAYVIMLCITIFLRRCFLNYVGVEYLGYESLFANIFTIMATTEMGVSKNISYHLYKAFSEKDEKEIIYLYNIYKWIYFLIGGFILIAGIICSFFLEQFITGNTLNALLLRIIYYLQLANILRTYFLSYPRMLYTADQKENVHVLFDTVFNVSFNIIKIFSIFLFRDYIIYLILTLLGGICSDLYMFKIIRRDYKYIKSTKIKLSHIKERGLLKDIKNFIGHQLAGTVFCGTDNIIIAKILGIVYVGYFSNYIMIKNQIMSIVTRVFQPLQASIGNLVYSEDCSKRQNLYYMVNLFSFCMASFIAISVAALAQTFVTVVFGNSYVLSYLFVILLAANMFVEIIRGMQSYFRFVYGEYEKDRRFVVWASILNIILSIILSYRYKLEGILLGTLIGNLVIWYGNIRFFKEKYLKEAVISNIIKNVGLWCICIIEGVIVIQLCRPIDVSLAGFFKRLLICITVPNLCNSLIFIKSHEYNTAQIYIQAAIGTIKKKMG